MTLKFDLTGIATKEMAVSLRFYRLLGLPIPVDKDREAHVEFDFGGYRLAWDTHEIIQMVYGEWAPEVQGHRIELAFRCDSPEEVDKTYQRMIANGYPGHKEPWDAVWGQRYAILIDPDGNLISLFAPLVPPMMPSKTVSVSIDSPLTRVYEFVSNPQNLSKWADGLETPDGRMPIRFVDSNSFGVLDHYASPSPGIEILNAMRVIPNGRGSELLFTLFRAPTASEEAFTADVRAVEGDLQRLKRLMEAETD